MRAHGTRAFRGLESAAMSGPAASMRHIRTMGVDAILARSIVTFLAIMWLWLESATTVNQCNSGSTSRMTTGAHELQRAPPARGLFWRNVTPAGMMKKVLFAVAMNFHTRRHHPRGKGHRLCSRRSVGPHRGRSRRPDHCNRRQVRYRPNRRQC